MESNAYSAIAGVYDLLNEEIDYSAWADFIEDCFKRFSERKPELVLDLACGTGRMTAELAKRGYDMTGVDASEEMLAVAYEKSVGKGILYLHQDMRSFELYGTVDAVAVTPLKTVAQPPAPQQAQPPAPQESPAPPQPVNPAQTQAPEEEDNPQT